MGFLLNFHVGIVQEFCQGWQNFNALVETYHGYVKFCRIGRILKVLGYVYCGGHAERIPPAPTYP
jgi:hypothetical protein